MPQFFQGVELSFEAKLALKTLPSLDSIDELLVIVLAAAGGEAPDADSLRHLQQVTALDTKTLGALFTGIDWLVRAGMRSSLKAKALAAELTDLKVHPPFVDAVAAAITRGCVP
jgi:hypothetical protein